MNSVIDLAVRKSEEEDGPLQLSTITRTSMQRAHAEAVQDYLADFGMDEADDKWFPYYIGWLAHKIRAGKAAEQVVA